MNFETIELAIDARGIATVTFNRPDKHNALSETMIAELAGLAAQLGADPNVRVVVLAAKGKSFCAGGDLNWMRAQAEKDREGKIAQTMALANMLSAWNFLPKPVIAKVHGGAFGGGVGVVAIADIAIAAEGVRFGLTETKLGLIPATISPFILRAIGEGFARQVFLNSKPFGTDFALRSGLLAAVCAADQLDAAVENECAAFLQCAPGAVADAKALCLKLNPVEVDSLLSMTANALADRWETDEALKGISAFLDSAR